LKFCLEIGKYSTSNSTSGARDRKTFFTKKKFSQTEKIFIFIFILKSVVPFGNFLRNTMQMTEKFGNVFYAKKSETIKGIRLIYGVILNTKRAVMVKVINFIQKRMTA
jgi:hypothetical protein